MKRSPINNTNGCSAGWHAVTSRDVTAADLAKELLRDV